MATVKTPTVVQTASEVEQTLERRTSKVWFFFTTEWWGVVSTRYIGNDIQVKTDNPIRAVYVNDVEYLPTPSK